MSKQKFLFRSWRNKYILFFFSLILCFSILTPVKAHYLTNNQFVISQSNTSQQKPKRKPQRSYELPPTVTPIKKKTTALTKRTGFCKKSNSVINEKSDSAINLTLLAPKSHAGLMTSENPTLAWYVPDSKPYPIEIFVSRDGEDEPFYSTNIGEIHSKQGINEYILPKAIKLHINQIYTWKVKIYCNSLDLSQSYEDESWFKLIEIPSNLKSQIQLINYPLFKAEVYAVKGIWYDAFMQTLQSHDSEKITREYQQSLLRNLAKKDGSKELKQQLEKIIEQMNV